MTETMNSHEIAEPTMNGIGETLDTYDRHNGAAFDYCEPASSEASKSNGDAHEHELNGDCPNGLEGSYETSPHMIQLQEIPSTDKTEHSASFTSNPIGRIVTHPEFLPRFQINPNPEPESELLRKKRMRKEKKARASKQGWTQSNDIEGYKAFEDIEAQLAFVGENETDKQRPAKRSHSKVKKTKSASMANEGKSLSDGEGKPTETAENTRRERSASPQMEKNLNQNGANQKSLALKPNYKTNSSSTTSPESEPPTWDLPFDDSDFQLVDNRRKKSSKQAKAFEPAPKPAVEQRRASSLEPNNNSIRKPHSGNVGAGARKVLPGVSKTTESVKSEPKLNQASFPVLSGRRRSWGDIRMTADDPPPSSCSLTDDESVKSQPLSNTNTNSNEINSWAKVAQGYKAPPPVDMKPKPAPEPNQNPVPVVVPTNDNSSPPQNNEYVDNKPSLKANVGQTDIAAKAPDIDNVSKPENSSQKTSAIEVQKPTIVKVKSNIMSTSLNIDFISMHESRNPDEDTIIMNLLTRSINGIILSPVPKSINRHARKASSLPPAFSEPSPRRAVEFLDNINVNSSTTSSICFGFPEPLTFGFEPTLSSKTTSMNNPRDTISSPTKDFSNRHRYIVAMLKRQWQSVLDERKREGGRRRVIWHNELPVI